MREGPVVAHALSVADGGWRGVGRRGSRRTLAWLGRRGHRGGALGAAVGRHLLAEPLEALSAVLLEEWEAAGDAVRLEQPDAAASKRAGSNPSTIRVAGRC